MYVFCDVTLLRFLSLLLYYLCYNQLANINEDNETFYSCVEIIFINVLTSTCLGKARVFPFTGLDYWTGLLDWTGLDWTGLDWTGLDWTGLDWTGRLDSPKIDYIEKYTTHGARGLFV